MHTHVVGSWWQFADENKAQGKSIRLVSMEHKHSILASCTSASLFMLGKKGLLTEMRLSRTRIFRVAATFSYYVKKNQRTAIIMMSKHQKM